jgi:hypothetical protein
MEQEESIRNNIFEFTGDITTEIKTVLKRLETLESMFSHILEPGKIIGTTSELPDILDQVKDILEMKIKRKKLTIILKVANEANIISEGINPVELKMALFEVLYRLIEASSNRDTIVVESVNSGLRFRVEPATVWADDYTGFVPAFLPDNFKLEIMPFKGFFITYVK